jgi:hypothetical protein
MKQSVGPCQSPQSAGLTRSDQIADELARFRFVVHHQDVQPFDLGRTSKMTRGSVLAASSSFCEA